MEIKAGSEYPDAAKFAQEFSQLPGRVRRDPYRAGLAPEGLARSFLTMPYPQPREFFIVQEHNQTLGRISAQVSATNPEAGSLGFFEVDLNQNESVSQLLIQTACHWLTARGVKKVYGPMNFNSWFSYRFRIDEREPLPFGWEPVNPPRFPEFFKLAGFKQEMLYATTGYEDPKAVDAFVRTSRPDYNAAIKKGYVYQPIDPVRLLSEDLPDLYSLSMESFKNNFLFEPIPFEVFSQLYVPIVNRVDISLSNFVYNPSGKKVGFFFCFIDQGAVIMKTMAILPEARGHGLSNGLYYLATKQAQDRGITRLVHALVQMGNQSESYGKKATYSWKHEYALFSKG